MRRSRIDELFRAQTGVFPENREIIEEIQLKKLNDLLARERERNGFYRRLPTQLSSLSELANLPFTTDEDLAHNAAGLLLTSQADVRRILSDATSGTTGAAKRVFYTEGDCENTIALFMAGLGEFVFPGSVTMIAMPFSGERGLGELISEAITRLGARPIPVGYPRSYAELSQILDSERPDTFVGMPTQLLGMLRYCGRGSLERALVSGDACPETVLRKCEDILGTRLFPHYGSREMGLGGAICCDAHEGMHLREHHVIAEIVDEHGCRVPDGEVGELVITVVGMEALPLIRYRTGDFTRILPGRCACGSAMLRLDTVRRFGEGAKIAVLDDALFALDGMIDFKAERTGSHIHLTALTDGTLDAGTIRSRAENALGEYSFTVTARTAVPDDLPLYFAKRSILTTKGG